MWENHKSGSRRRRGSEEPLLLYLPKSTAVPAPERASVPAPWINTTAYDDAIAAIIFA